MDELNLYQSLTNSDFVFQTIQQIEKDFMRCDIPINLNNTKNRVDIEESIFNSIHELSAIKLQQLVYMVDIPEQEFLKIMSKPYYYQSLSESILRREALKIYIRKNY
jgi:hypothetical protein